MNQAINFIKKNIYTISYGLLFLLAIFLHFYKLADIPYGLHVDEAGLGSNAWCLANFGTDRYGNAFPIYPQNFDGGQSPLYTYFATLLVFLNHKTISTFVLRLPGALMGLGSIYFGSKTIKLFLGKNAALLSALLFTILPYGIMQSRFAFDCNAMFFCCILSLYTLVNYIYNKKTYQLILCGMAFGLTLYSYSISYIVIALFLTFSFFYLLYTKEVPLSKLLLAGLIMLITALPIVLFVLVILTSSDGFTFLGVSILPIASQRTSELSFHNFFDNIYQSLLGTLTDMSLVYDAIRTYGTIFKLSILFFIIGLVISIKDFITSIITKKTHISSFFLFFYIAELIMSGIIHFPAIYRLNGIFASIYFFIVYGIVFLYNTIKKYRTIYVAILSVTYLSWFFSFANYYFRIYPTESFPQLYFQTSCQPAIDYVEESLTYEKLFIDYSGYKEYYFFDNPNSPYFSSSYFVDGIPESCPLRFHVDYNTTANPNNVYIVKSYNTDAIKRLCTQGIEPTIIPSENYYYIIYFER